MTSTTSLEAGGVSMRASIVRNERGIALITTLMVTLIVAAIIMTMVMLSTTTVLVGKSNERSATLDAVALSGLEEARSKMNGNKTLYPTSGYLTIENGATVKDASGATIPKVTRSVYMGPTGISTGQYGVVGSIVSVAQDSFGNKVVRRLETNQESFSKFAYFTNIERDTAGTLLSFLNNDQIQGPVHSNDTIHIASSGATFFGKVTSAKSYMSGASNGTFNKGYTLGVAKIPMPTVADLNRLDSLATVGSSRFTGYTVGGTGEARTRLLFKVIDMGGTLGPQGFFMVYQGNDTAYVSASLPPAATGAGLPAYLEKSPNCGDVVGGLFLATIDHDGPFTGVYAAYTPGHLHNYTGTLTQAQKDARRDSSLIAGGNAGQPNNLPRSGIRCYLGGDSILTTPGTGNNWLTTGQRDGGAWVQAPAAISNALATTSLAGRNDLNYLFPLNRTWNPDFKGVIYVSGKVIVSGVIHGRVTVAAAGNIIFADDATYYQNPATRDCQFGDIAGWFSGQSIIFANNTLNAPQTVNTNMSWASGTSSTTGVRSYGATIDETIHGFFLSLKTVGAERYDLGNMAAQVCTSGGSSTVGRGCLNTYGGLIEGNRGAVTQTGGGGATGYAKRYQYDACGATYPPPYFPTTGVFAKNRFIEMDPVRFNVANWFSANQH
jgi:cytoskeletal protein CcmA (bactofilin family)